MEKIIPSKLVQYFPNLLEVASILLSSYVLVETIVLNSISLLELDLASYFSLSCSQQSLEFGNLLTNGIIVSLTETFIAFKALD